MNDVIKVGVQLKKSVQSTQRTFDEMLCGEEHIWSILEYPVHCL